MALKASVFIATSLDGFIARPDGSIDWLNQANALMPPDEDCGYKAFMATVDTLVVGRHTFEQVLTFDEWPYGEKRVVVMSSRLLTLPPELPKTVSVSAEAPAVLIKRLAAAGARHLYVDGGVTIQRFLAADAIDEMTITLIPVLLGAGKTLFGPLAGDVQLTHLGTRVYEFGFVQVQYGVVKAG